MTDIKTVQALVPDTSSMAYSGRSVDYLNGYETGFEAAKDALIAQMQRDAGRRFCGRCGDPLMSDGTDLCYCCNQTMMQRDAVQLVATRIIETPHTHPDSWQPAPEPQQDDHAGSPAPSLVGYVAASAIVQVRDGRKVLSAIMPTSDPIFTEALYTHPTPSAQSSKATLSDEELLRIFLKATEGRLTSNAYLKGIRAILARAGITRKPLSDEEIQEVWIEHGLDECDPEGFVRAIEAAHGITPQAGKESGE